MTDNAELRAKVLGLFDVCEEDILALELLEDANGYTSATAEAKVYRESYRAWMKIQADAVAARLTEELLTERGES